jgi:YVTN family beta-propeller protein
MVRTATLVRTALAVMLLSTAAAAAAAPGLTAGKTSYARGEPIQLTFAGGPGNPTDWVGVYPTGVQPGTVGSTLWYYVDGSRTAGAGLTSGTLSFGPGSGSWPLAAGRWDAYFLANDGYTVLAMTSFDVSGGPTSILSTDRTIYRPGETITVQFSEGPGSPTDWVGIYADGEVPGTVGSTLWGYVGGGHSPGAGATAGTLTFAAQAGRGPLRAGRWKAYLLASDGYAMLAYASFWVGDPGATGLTPNGWLIAPDGRQSLVGSGPLAVVAAGPDHLLVANGGYDHQSLMLVEAGSGRVLQTVMGLPDGSGGHYVGLVASRDGHTIFAADGTNDAIRTFTLAGGKLVEGDPIRLPSGTWPAGLALSRDERRLLVAGNLSDSLLAVDLGRRVVTATTPVGHLPYGVAWSRDEQRAYVTNWGADTVTVLDGRTLAVKATLRVGNHPSALLQSATRDELYVACTDSDQIAVLDSAAGRLLRSLSLAPWEGAPPGASPNALALSPDGRTLYVANAGDNDVAVVRLARAGASRGDRVAGLIPAAWHPSGLVLDRSGRTLHVLNMKGLGVGPVAPGAYIADQLQGTLSAIEVPGEDQLEAATGRVARNDRFPGLTAEDRHEEEEGSPLPRHPGEPSPIKHVIYVLKENRTYDQVLGDLGRGNGDPSLAIFGEQVTPNHHELARRFVTLDNFYCDGEVSADGWIWSNAASANTYNQKNWPQDYGWAGRLYDFGGFGNDETAGFPGPDPTRAMLWDRLAERGISYRNYGFFLNGLSGTPPTQTLGASMPGLVGHTDLSYSGWDMYYPDSVRIQEWVREFREFERQGELPTVSFVYLPRDHTVGTATGANSPVAMVADNDQAFGVLVEAVSHSRFWESTVIFSIEDDAQDGPDHVDGHRTVAMAISPWTQAGRVDSTHYSTVSMLRTIELLVGIEPLTHFDALARPMRKAFTATPDRRPYDLLPPRVPLAQRNLSGAPLAAESSRMDFSRPDAANHRELNEAIWRSVRGMASRMPEPRQAVALRP